MKWKLVPIEPTLEMLESGGDCMTCSSNDVWGAMLDAAPTPPEVEPVGYVSAGGIKKLRDKYADGQSIFPNKGIIYSEPLYTSPSSPKADWDADGNPLNLEAAAMDLWRWYDDVQVSRSFEKLMDNLRKFLPEGKL